MAHHFGKKWLPNFCYFMYEFRILTRKKPCMKIFASGEFFIYYKTLWGIREQQYSFYTRIHIFLLNDSGKICYEGMNLITSQVIKLFSLWRHQILLFLRWILRRLSYKLEFRRNISFTNSYMCKSSNHNVVWHYFIWGRFVNLQIRGDTERCNRKELLMSLC